MELRNYIYPLRRWWWLIVAATVVAALSSFIVTARQAPLYQATTTLMIGRTIEDPNPSSNEFFLGQQLASTYANVANREQVRSATKEALGINWLPSYRAVAQLNSQFIVISVQDTDPERAQAVANELARQLILLTPTSSEQEKQEREGFINEQLDMLEAQIKQTQEDIDQLQVELGNLISARQISDTQNQITALQGKLTTLQGNYANLLSNTGKGAVNTLTVIEPAAVPVEPVGPNKAIAILVSSMIGLVLASGAAYLLEYLDNTIKTPSDIERVGSFPVIGRIFEYQDRAYDKPVVSLHPRHPISEAFRSLRTNLEFANVDGPTKSILVASAQTGDGKTSVAANLAVSLAQAGKQVIVLDADMRYPSVHTFFDLPQDPGLSDIFRGRIDLGEALHPWKDEPLSVITSGGTPPNPTELLDSKKMDQLLEELERMADVVIIDGPPYVVADAAVLSAKVDGVILVMRPGFTRKAAGASMVDQIKLVGAKVLGVVLNGIPKSFIDYYGGKHYTSYSSENGRYFEEGDALKVFKKMKKMAARQKMKAPH